MSLREIAMIEIQRLDRALDDLVTFQFDECSEAKCRELVRLTTAFASALEAMPGGLQIIEKPVAAAYQARENLEKAMGRSPCEPHGWNDPSWRFLFSFRVEHFGEHLQRAALDSGSWNDVEAVYQILQAEERNQIAGQAFILACAMASSPPTANYNDHFRLVATIYFGKGKPTRAVQEAARAVVDKVRPRHGPDFAEVRWFGTRHTFTGHQRAAIRALWEAWEEGVPEVGIDHLRHVADLSIRSRLVDLFGSDHSAWGTMIVKGERKDTFRLQPPDAIS